MNTNPIRFAKLSSEFRQKRESACFIYGYIILYLINEKPEIYIIYIYIYRTENESVTKNEQNIQCYFYDIVLISRNRKPIND